MIRVAPLEKDAGDDDCEKHPGDAVGQFRVNAGLNSREYSAPVFILVSLHRCLI
jgi:hypothetical protein